MKRSGTSGLHCQETKSSKGVDCTRKVPCVTESADRSGAARKCVNDPADSRSRDSRVLRTLSQQLTQTHTLALIQSISSSIMLSCASSRAGGAPRSPLPAGAAAPRTTRLLMPPACFLSHVPLSSRAPSSGQRVAQHRPGTICRFKASLRFLQRRGNGLVCGAYWSSVSQSASKPNFPGPSCGCLGTPTIHLM